MSNYTLEDILTWLDQTLDPEKRPDYGPNGLQVDARPLRSTPIRKIVTGVTSNLALIEKAISEKADLLLVHHGLYWNGADPTATGALGRRLAVAFQGGLSIAGYHLPLDAHLLYGNAVGLGRAMGLTHFEAAFPYKGLPTGVIGRYEEALPLELFRERLEAISSRSLLFQGGPKKISNVGIVTGGAPRLAEDAAVLGLHAFITGEASEYSQATAIESKIHVAACGHHRSETFGAKLLVPPLKEAFPGLEVLFIDVDNPA